MLRRIACQVVVAHWAMVPGLLSDARAARTDSRQKMVADFTVQPAETLEVAVRRLTHLLGMSAGIELVPRAECYAKKAQDWVHFRLARAEHVLDCVVGKCFGYEWSFGDNVLHVRPPKELLGPNWPLDEIVHTGSLAARSDPRSWFAGIWSRMAKHGYSHTRFGRVSYPGEELVFRPVPLAERMTLRRVLDQLAVQNGTVWIWSASSDSDGIISHSLRFMPVVDPEFQPGRVYSRILGKLGASQPDRVPAEALMLLVSDPYSVQAGAHEVATVLLRSFECDLDAQQRNLALSALQDFVIRTDLCSPPYSRVDLTKRLAGLAACETASLSVRSSAITTLGLLGAAEALPRLMGIKERDAKLRGAVRVAALLVAARSRASVQARCEGYVALIVGVAARERPGDDDIELCRWADRCLFAERTRLRREGDRDRIIVILKNGALRCTTPQGKKLIDAALASLR